MSELPSSWAWTAIAQICESITDGDHQPPPQVQTGVPFLVIGNVRDRVLNFADCRHVPPEYFESLNPIRRPREGDVLYTLVGSYGIPVLVKDDTPFCVQRHIGILRPSREISASFLALVLSSRAVFDQATEFATGTAQLTVPLSGLRRIRVPLPPRPEQERIVAAIEEQFSRIDAGVAALQRVAQNLQRMRSIVLNGLLVDADGRDWRSVPMREILQRGRYGTSTKCAYDGRGLPVVRIPNIQSGRVDLQDLKRALDQRVDLGGSLIEEGDVLIIRTNGSRSLIGRAAVVATQDEPISFASYLIQLRFDHSVLDPQYLVAVLAAPRVRTRVEQLAATTAGQYNISLDKLRSLEIPLPPLEAQETLLTTADDQLGAIARLESELLRAERHQERLRSSILTAAFSGQLARQDSSDEEASKLLDRIAALSGDQPAVRGYKSRVKVTA